MLEKPLIPSGFWTGPRPALAPIENAEEATPTTTQAKVSHANHLQPLLGNRPVGNRINENSCKPIIGGSIQDEIQAIASPAGSELGCADKV